MNSKMPQRLGRHYTAPPLAVDALNLVKVYQIGSVDSYEVFTRIRTHAGQPRGKDILRQAHGFDPLLIVEFEFSTGALTDRYQPPSTVIWGDISPPLL